MEIDLRNKKVGDVIECGNKLGDALKLRHQLSNEGIEAEFVFSEASQYALKVKRINNDL